MLWASILSLFGCQAKPIPLDFGHGIIHLDKKFRHRPDQTDYEPTHVKFYFTRVNDTHFNGQTSYAEELTLTTHAQPCSFPLKAKSELTTSTDGPLDFQSATAQYDRDPIHEPALVLCLTNKSKNRSLSWYGYAKHYKLEAAKQYLKQIDATLELDPITQQSLESYKTWSGNAWMEAYFENKPKLIAALEKHGLEIPYQPYIGALSNWQPSKTNQNLMAAIDGQRPAHLHIIESIANNPTTTLTYANNRWRQQGPTPISTDLLPELTAQLDKKLTHNYKVCRFNLWQPLPKDGNAILTWLDQCRKE